MVGTERKHSGVRLDEATDRQTNKERGPHYHLTARVWGLPGNAWALDNVHA